MNQLTKQRLTQLFIMTDGTILYYSLSHQEWRDIYNKHAYKSNADGVPVSAGMRPFEGEYQSEGYEEVRVKFGAVDDANDLVANHLLMDLETDLGDEEENLNTLANRWSYGEEASEGVDQDKLHGDVYDHLCHVFPDYA